MQDRTGLPRCGMEKASRSADLRLVARFLKNPAFDGIAIPHNDPQVRETRLRAVKAERHEITIPGGQRGRDASGYEQFCPCGAD